MNIIGLIIKKKKFLHNANVNPVFQHVRGKRMPESMATDALGNAGAIDGGFDGFLQPGFQDVMPPRFAAAGIDADFFGRENKLASKRLCRWAQFALQRPRQKHVSETIR